MSVIRIEASDPEAQRAFDLLAAGYELFASGKTDFKDWHTWASKYEQLQRDVLDRSLRDEIGRLSDGYTPPGEMTRAFIELLEGRGVLKSAKPGPSR